MIIAVPGYPTTWGSNAFKEQVIETEATVVRLLREAGAVMLAKLATGELAGGDRWFGGRTNSPWDPSMGSSGSSAGPASATGLVAFGIGTETSGSILSPSTRCGVTGLRPTFGRVSRHGAMTLSWTRDRILRRSAVPDGRGLRGRIPRDREDGRARSQRDRPAVQLGRPPRYSIAFDSATWPLRSRQRAAMPPGSRMTRPLSTSCGVSA